jgi:hypothetical protein
MGAHHSAVAGEAAPLGDGSAFLKDFDTYACFLGTKSHTIEVLHEAEQDTYLHDNWQTRRNSWQAAVQNHKMHSCHDPRALRKPASPASTSSQTVSEADTLNKISGGSSRTESKTDEKVIEAAKRIHLYFAGKHDPYEGSFKSRNCGAISGSVQSDSQSRSKESSTEGSGKSLEELRHLNRTANNSMADAMSHLQRGAKLKNALSIYRQNDDEVVEVTSSWDLRQRKHLRATSDVQ